MALSISFSLCSRIWERSRVSIWPLIASAAPIQDRNRGRPRPRLRPRPRFGSTFRRLIDLDGAAVVPHEGAMANAFAALGAPETLAAALAARGYETPTPVQEAVQQAEARGRDLLVSARTGSGKTVAFGLAVAPDILPLPKAGRPLALAVAPTRELAQQVARELSWLYAGARVSACVGGAGLGTDLRARGRQFAPLPRGAGGHRLLRHARRRLAPGAVADRARVRGGAALGRADPGRADARPARAARRAGAGAGGDRRRRARSRSPRRGAGDPGRSAAERRGAAAPQRAHRARGPKRDQRSPRAAGGAPSGREHAAQGGAARRLHAAARLRRDPRARPRPAGARDRGPAARSRGGASRAGRAALARAGRGVVRRGA